MWCDSTGKEVIKEKDCAATGLHCFMGECAETVCTPSEKFCVDDTNVGVCDVAGAQYEVAPCPGQHFCAEGTCQPWVCVPNQPTCAGDVAQVCDSAGSGYLAQVDCSAKKQVCVDGSCEALYCAPNAVYCLDASTAAVCAADGLSSTPQSCPSQHSCQDGQCKPWVCSPSAPVCDGTVATTCDSLGLSLLADGIDCALAGKFCIDGQCSACQPDCADKLCNDDDGCGNTCGLKSCPDLPGYTLSCNPQHHCEYANQDPTGWKKWDVWIYIPPGSLMMGSPEEETDTTTNCETPIHLVTFAKGFFIGKFEIVVEHYHACFQAAPDKCTTVPAVKHSSGWTEWGVNYWEELVDPKSGKTTHFVRLDHPQNALIWQQAVDFCAWVASGGRLASDAEWEYAASGPVHRKYPWGDTPAPNCDLAVYDDDEKPGMPWGCLPCPTPGCSGSSPVGSRPLGAAWSGALDMAGNVHEWVQDAGKCSYEGAPSNGTPRTIEGFPDAPLRNGSFTCHAGSMRTSRRSSGVDKKTENLQFGARCVRPLP